MEMNEFVTWQTLGTYAGAVMMVTIITQFLKQTPLKNINTQLLAYIISVAILIGAEAFNGAALTVQGVVLCLLNAVIVALAANGTYDAATTGMVSFCKYLRKMKVTGFTPEDITIPKGAPVGVRNILQPDDIVTLFSVDTTIYKGKLVKDPYINAYRLEVLTGLRPGELRGIMRNDFKQGRLEVRRSINEDNEITTGKNENAIRSVYLGEIAEAIVKDQASKSNGLYLFQMPTTETYRKFFQRYCNANGIPKTTPYELRHTFVSLAQSLPEGWVKQLVGHSKSMDTFGVYGHAVSGMDRQITSALDGVFTSILGQQEKK
jgi:integrase